MKILVCISHVPDTTSKINFAEGDTKFDTNGVQFVINPNDEFGLTRAMWFKEKQGASVDVVNVGGPETEPTLRKALAIGADGAIRVNTGATDGFAVAKHTHNNQALPWWSAAKMLCADLFQVSGALKSGCIGYKTFTSSQYRT